jgi:hypothetical protein
MKAGSENTFHLIDKGGCILAAALFFVWIEAALLELETGEEVADFKSGCVFCV